jgi:hypothetical protein
LARLEVLVKPIRIQDLALAQNFDNFFAAQIASLFRSIPRSFVGQQRFGHSTISGRPMRYTLRAL